MITTVSFLTKLLRAKIVIDLTRYLTGKLLITAKTYSSSITTGLRVCHRKQTRPLDE